MCVKVTLHTQLLRKRSWPCALGCAVRPDGARVQVLYSPLGCSLSVEMYHTRGQPPRASALARSRCCWRVLYSSSSASSPASSFFEAFCKAGQACSISAALAAQPDTEGAKVRNGRCEGAKVRNAHLLVAALDAAGAAAAEGAVQRKVDVLLRVGADHEGRHVHDLLANAATDNTRQCRAAETPGGAHAAHRMWRWRISTRAWCMDLARPSLNTWVCRRRSRKLSIDSVST